MPPSEYAFDFDEMTCFRDGIYFGKITRIQTLVLPFFVEVETALKRNSNVVVYENVRFDLNISYAEH